MNVSVKADGNRKAGFTLIEIMLVVIIIGILAAVVVGRFAGHGEKARRNATRMSIKNICVAIEAYELENGSWPESISDLTRATEDHAAPLSEVPVDAWGTEFQYKTTGPYSYEVRSAAKDGQFGTGDDITN